MAFVPGYAHDLFISYAHVDDEPMGDAKEGWVSTLFRELRAKLSQKLGRTDAFDAWKDDGLSRNEGVTPQIMEAITSTALLVIVLSPGYLSSTWCLREKDSFLRHLRERRRPGSRVFVIERDEVERSQRPDSISDLIGHRFWTKDKIEDPAETLCEAGLNSTDLGYQEYFRRLNHLATDLKKELEALKAGGGQVLQRHTRPTVFLAESTDDVDNLRTDLLEYLDQLDIPVLPQTLYDREAEAFRDAMTTDLSHSKLFVQLLSGLRGRKAPGGSAGYPRLQYDIARARGAEILQWRDQRLDVDGVPDEDQRKLLREVTVRAEGVEDFKRYIKQRLLEEPKPVVVPKQGLRAIVFVDSDKDDWDLAIAIRDRLKALGVDVSLPVWDQAPDEVRLDLEANLKQCHALIVVYGKSTVSWVRQQLLGLYRKAIAQREEPLQALAVYQGPPENKPALHIDIQNLRLIDSTNVPSNEVDAMLREFISQLQII